MPFSCCISFDSYIKPQLRSGIPGGATVVYLLIPTSNHNQMPCVNYKTLVVYLLIPTSNHNIWQQINYFELLYIFWFLHQTTTKKLLKLLLRCCISFDSYIKPQRVAQANLQTVVVYLLIPTSNHNMALVYLLIILLYIFWFLHQTTTWYCDGSLNPELYIFWFLHQTTTTTPSIYIKTELYIFWFLHQTTTYRRILKFCQLLYIFWFLHQTTTTLGNT